MLTSVHPKLPMRNKAITRDYYLNQLGFEYAPLYRQGQKNTAAIHIRLILVQTISLK